jgi:hypothetical protein
MLLDPGNGKVNQSVLIHKSSESGPDRFSPNRPCFSFEVLAKPTEIIAVQFQVAEQHLHDRFPTDHPGLERAPPSFIGPLGAVFRKVQRAVGGMVNAEKQHFAPTFVQFS